MEDRLVRIARVLVAKSFRIVKHDFGFSKESPSGILVLQYRYYPELWAYPKDGKAVIVHCKPEQTVLREIFSGKSSNSFAKEIYTWFATRNALYASNAERNARVLISNKLHNEGITSEAEGLLAGRKETMSVAEAKDLLTNHYDVRTTTFDKAFGVEQDENGAMQEGFVIEKVGNFRVVLNHCPEFLDNAKKVVNAVTKIIEGWGLGDLLYGTIEFIGDFQRKWVAADYLSTSDDIRVKEGDDLQQLVAHLVHELGHRWQDKKASPGQLKSLKSIYTKMKRPFRYPFRQGDKMTFDDLARMSMFYSIDNPDSSPDKDYVNKHPAEQSFVLKSETRNFVDLVGEQDGKIWFAEKKKVYPLVLTVNGKDFSPGERAYEFPSRYSSTKFEEFVSEVFKFTLCGMSMDEFLKRDFLHILIG